MNSRAVSIAQLAASSGNVTADGKKLPFSTQQRHLRNVEQQTPCSFYNEDTHYPLLEAVMGLARIGAPIETSPSPSTGGRGALASTARDEDLNAERKERWKSRTFPTPLPDPNFFKPTINEAITCTTLTNSNPRQELREVNAAHLNASFGNRHHDNAIQRILQSYPALSSLLLNNPSNGSALIGRHHDNAIKDILQSYPALSAILLDNPSNGSSLIGRPLMSSLSANHLLSGHVSAGPRVPNTLDRVSSAARLAAGLPNMNFPETLFAVLSTPEYERLLSWLPHGRGFLVHDKRGVADVVLPRHFDGAKYASFVRRLKRWNFRRVSKGPDLGAHYNRYFVRGAPDLVQKMRYHKDGQFEEGKRESEETHEEGEWGKAVGGVQEQDSESVARTDETACPPGKSSPKPHPNQVLLPMTIQSDTDCPLPLPSSLGETNRVASNSAAANKSPKKHPAMAHAESLLLPRTCPNLPRSNEHTCPQSTEAQLNHLLELQRRALSSRFTAPDDGAHGRRGGTGYLSENVSAGQPCRLAASASPPLLDAWLLEQKARNHQELQSRMSSALALAPDRYLSHGNGDGYCHGQALGSLLHDGVAGTSALPQALDVETAKRMLDNQELELRNASFDIDNASGAEMRQTRQGLAFSLEASRSSHEGTHRALNRTVDACGGRAVLLSREEEHEFVRYLALKRIAQETSAARKS